ncbi:hypothetical protein QUF95_07035 [Paenibacillus silvae]|uniref:hypothetical protein n=1 Tax=Paenibacillus silvae TaxID=1325358 RepID=UPI0025A148E5|nr:hypothetical protein [Paenibacillus silvae]MDM5277130.1 hypothetical protein [Paenibacillus silvae]
MDTKNVKINLGTIELISKLYSYPNNCKEICFLPQTLEETIALYIQSSLTRDQLNNTVISISTNNSEVFIELNGPESDIYGKHLNDYLSVGNLGLEASQKLHKDNKWRYNWRFFLPHGVAMLKHKTVQLLHFPPDYVLERDQDYLKANTTKRWSSLLVENNVSPNDTDSYQNIIDIAPIAAPSSDGRNLDGVYDYYNEYILALLKLWLPLGHNLSRPMVAFGSPVKKWIKNQFDETLNVLSLKNLNISENLITPTLGANHPSFIYNATDRLKDNPDTPINEVLQVLMEIMKEDLIAAAWQARMGINPTADPQIILNECIDLWSNRDNEICVLAQMHALNKTLDEAKGICSNIHFMLNRNKISDRINQLREEIGSLDSQEPELEYTSSSLINK